MEFTFTVPHSLSVEQVAERLKALSGLKLTKVESRSEGNESGFDLEIDTKMVSGQVVVQVEAEPSRFLTTFVPESVVRNAIESKYRKALSA